MKKLEALLKGHDEPIHYPDDVATLKREIEELAPLPDATVQKLYGDWSEDQYSASWLILDRHSIDEFAQYLREEVQE